MSTHNKPLAFVGAAFALGVAITSAFGAPPADGRSAADPQLVAAVQRYEATKWAATAARAGLDLATVELPGLSGGTITRDASGAMVRAWKDAHGVDRVLVEAATLDTVADAHERHVSTIAFVQTTITLPTTASLGITAGDVGHVGRSGAGPGRISWIAFVRGNVHVRAVCLDPTVDPHPDMGVIAATIDRAILAETPLAPGARPAHPTIEHLTAASTECAAGKSVTLDLAATDARLVEWSVGGAGQGYVERDSTDGAWKFHATGVGKVEVAVVVSSPRGTSTGASVAIDVR